MLISRDVIGSAEGADRPFEPSRLAWGAILLLAIAQFSAFVDRALPAVFAPLLKTQFLVTDVQIGALQGPAFVCLYVVGLLAAAHWMRPEHAWRVAAACVAVWTLGVVIFALATDWQTLVVGRVLLGAGQAAFAPAALRLLTAQSDAGRRARALSTFTSGSAAGRSGALLLGGGALAVLTLVHQGSPEPWRLAGLVVMAPNVLLVGLLLSKSRQPGSALPCETSTGLGRGLAALKRRPVAYGGMLVTGAGCVLIVQSAGAWIPSLLNRSFDLTAAEAAITFGLVVLAFAPLGHLSAGWILAGRPGRHGPGLPIIAGVIAAGACALALPNVTVLATAIALLCGLTAGGGMAASAALIGLNAMTPQPDRTAVSALFLVTASLVGVGAGPWLTGLLSDALIDQGGLARALAVTVATATVVVTGVSLACSRLWRASLATPETFSSS